MRGCGGAQFREIGEPLLSISGHCLVVSVTQPSQGVLGDPVQSREIRQPSLCIEKIGFRAWLLPEMNSEKRC